MTVSKTDPRVLAQIIPSSTPSSVPITKAGTTMDSVIPSRGNRTVEISCCRLMDLPIVPRNRPPIQLKY